ncbi:N-acetyl sugar amidotransferase [Aliivibrio fischeri]|uniref:N-acetyl sugar amidotransferase n=1 Tax=Aliivibrio fischeri TaxID=668 RepID=UPI0012D91985|nr:N-acetyl sugar amidotransferase [Aliivibrio fischeri]MUK38116.1 N-acetyl sugar amidotransferase [Aliivibrio fischeri]MUL04031.1 N-acetyl sugar amidotransferase [Aliivibrio fischeri]
MSSNYTVCTKCVMDTSDSNITFDLEGVCNHCKKYDQLNVVTKQELEVFEQQLSEIRKREGKYNCIIGVSGGLDSSYLILHAVRDLGLRPLAVHIDNGWNSGLANINIHKQLSILGVDLYTEVIDWEEFRLMQIAILKSGVPDLEAPTDLFINYALRKVAKKFGIKHVLSGTNPQTEGVMGSDWSYGQRDPIYLKGLYEHFNGVSPVKLPFKNWYKGLYEQLGGGLNIVRPLKYTEYSKTLAVSYCESELGWIEYPRKHGESFITRFYQNYFLPVRFGFDKRRAHYSALILNGDMSREECLHKLENEDVIGKETQAEIHYFCKKLRISNEEFDIYMKQDKKYHNDYLTMKDSLIFKLGKKTKNMGIFSKGFIDYVRKIIEH